jgi:spore coat protein SA
MESKIFQVLSEAESFSEYYGGGTSRWTANVVRNDADTVVVCPESDGTWGFPTDRVRRVPALVKYRRFQHTTKGRMPWPIAKGILHRVLAGGLYDLVPGDIVWVQNRPEFVTAVGPFVKKHKARVVLHMHNSHIVNSPERIVRSLAVDRIVFVSKFLRDESLAKYPHLREVSVVVPNGADDAVFFPPPADQLATRNGRPPIILSVGRLIPEKGIHILVGAMRILHERGIPALAKIVGGANFGSNVTTPYVDELRRTAPPNVQFCGYVEAAELGNLFRDADIFCCPSVWNEPFAAINMEAMACAIPVVATRTGGTPEAFVDGGGILVEPNSEEELATALRTLVTDPSQRDQFAREGYASFRKNFTWQAVHQHYRNVIESLKPC